MTVSYGLPRACGGAIGACGLGSRTTAAWRAAAALRTTVSRAAAIADAVPQFPPDLPAEVWSETTRRYIQAYERLTGTTFEPGAYPVAPRIQEAMSHVSL